jgi:hypothetical protein
MAKTTTTVEDPDLVTSKNVDGNGRVYLGTDYADKKVRVVVERLDDESKPDESAFARELSRKSIATHEDDYFDKNPDWADDLEDIGEGN